MPVEQTTPVGEPVGYLHLYDYELLQTRRAGLPGEVGVELKDVVVQAFEFFRTVGLALLRCLHEHWSTEPVPGETTNLMELVAEADTSLLRFVHYNRRDNTSSVEPTCEEEEVFEDHKDFGLLTLVPISSVPGLHIWQRAAEPGGVQGHWIPIERLYAQSTAHEDLHLLVFCGETLDHVTASYFPAVRHRVMQPASTFNGLTPTSRMSSPFFLRASPEARVPDLDDRSKTCPLRAFEAAYDQAHSTPVSG